MKRVDIREHTKKYNELAKKAGSGTYPNKDIAKVGSMVGLGIGGRLLGVGVVGITQGAVYGIGSLIAGAATGLSNCYNLKRLKKKSR